VPVISKGSVLRQVDQESRVGTQVCLEKWLLKQQPFYGPLSGNYPGEPVPEEKKKHSPTTILIIIQSLSASSIYHDP